MSKLIIEANPAFQKVVSNSDQVIEVAEFFCDTIQGENFIGWPSAFLRLQYCTQSCSFCDTTAIWKCGNPYTFEELFSLMEEADLIRKFTEGQHLVLTGGSPLLQQDKLVPFLKEFIQRYGFKPYIEIENECTLMPDQELTELTDCWNNSPKTTNSGVRREVRYKPAIIKCLASLKNSWFKFVVSQEEDWTEIKNDFLDTDLINKNQVVLMPMGASQVELSQNREIVINLAVRENVRYSTREQIVLWDKKTGV